MGSLQVGPGLIKSTPRLHTACCILIVPGESIQWPLGVEITEQSCRSAPLTAARSANIFIKTRSWETLGSLTTKAHLQCSAALFLISVGFIFLPWVVSPNPKKRQMVLPVPYPCICVVPQSERAPRLVLFSESRCWAPVPLSRAMLEMLDSDLAVPAGLVALKLWSQLMENTWLSLNLGCLNVARGVCSLTMVWVMKLNSTFNSKCF